MKKFFALCTLIICVLSFLTACGESGGFTMQDKLNGKTDFSSLNYSLYSEEDRIHQFSLTNKEHLKVLGRAVFASNNALQMDNSGSGFEVSVLASQLTATFNVKSGGENSMYIQTYINDVKADRIKVETGTTVIASGLDNTRRNTIRVVKATENDISTADLLTLSTDGTFLKLMDVNRLKIEVYGDSLTTGYGALGDASVTTFRGVDQDCTSTYAYAVGEHYRADVHLVAHQGWAVKHSRWGLRNIPDIYDQVTDYNEEKWNFDNFKADIVIINLGSNDDVEMSDAYYQFILKLKAKHPNAIFICISGMLEHSVERDVSAMISEHEDEAIFENVYHVKFPYGLTDGSNWHSSKAQHQTCANILLDFLKSL